MIYDKFGQGQNLIPLLAPVDTAATAIPTEFVALKGVLEGSLCLFFGNIAAASADEAVTVTLEAATTSASGSETAIAFNYRLSGAVASNTMGAITAATSTGASIATTDDGKILVIDIDPAAIQSAKADATYIRAVVTPNAEGTITIVGGWAELTQAYSLSTMKSAT